VTAVSLGAAIRLISSGAFPASSPFGRSALTHSGDGRTGRWSRGILTAGSASQTVLADTPDAHRPLRSSSHRNASVDHRAVTERRGPARRRSASIRSRRRYFGSRTAAQRSPSGSLAGAHVERGVYRSVLPELNAIGASLRDRGRSLALRVRAGVRAHARIVRECRRRPLTDTSRCRARTP
jgi:hypothetical protein